MGNCKSCIKSKTSDDLSSAERQNRKKTSVTPASNTDNQESLAGSSTVNHTRPPSAGSHRSVGSNSRPRSSKSRKLLTPQVVQNDNGISNERNANEQAAQQKDNDQEIVAPNFNQNIIIPTYNSNYLDPQNRKFPTSSVYQGIHVIQVKSSGTAETNAVVSQTNLDGAFTNMQNTANYSQNIPNNQLTDLVAMCNTIEKACACLWERDSLSGMRLILNKDFFVNKDGRNMQKGFVYKIADEYFLNRPTVCKFTDLLDLYNQNIRPNHWAIESFLTTVINTEVMKLCFLVSKKWRYVNSDEDFFTSLKQIWFPKKTKKSPFQKHFYGIMTDRDEFFGLHNWIHYYREQFFGNINTSKVPVLNENMVKFEFEWNNVKKSCSSMFLGSSPECEFAIYTLLYLCSSCDGKSANKPVEYVYNLALGNGQSRQVSVLVIIEDGYLKSAYPKAKRK